MGSKAKFYKYNLKYRLKMECLKKQMRGGINVNLLDIPISMEYKQALNFNGDIFVELGLLGSGSSGNVYLFANKKYEEIAVKKYMNDGFFLEEKEKYENIPQHLKELFPKSKFITIESVDGLDDYNYLIMENLYPIDKKFLTKNIKNILYFAKIVVSKLQLLMKNNIFYTDLKIQNMMQNKYYDDNIQYYFIDFGGFCFPPNFNCQMTYYNVNQNTKNMRDINDAFDIQKIKNSYEIILRNLQDSPLTPLTPLSNIPDENYMQKIEYYLIFLLWLMIIELFDDDKYCIANFHPIEIHKYSNDNINLLVENIKKCNSEILEKIDNLIMGGEFNDENKIKIKSFFNLLSRGKILNFLQLQSILESFFIEQ